jgi:hypothetical protein
MYDMKRLIPRQDARFLFCRKAINPNDAKGHRSEAPLLPKSAPALPAVPDVHYIPILNYIFFTLQA